MAGRLTLVTSVLSALPAYQLMAIFHPKWLHKQLDKLRRAFFWAASDKVSGGKSLGNWKTVCLPKSLGGLGIPDLQMQNISLTVRWLWQQATDVSKPWQGHQLPVDGLVTAIFQASTIIHIHNGRATSFWWSHWLQGVPLCNRFPNLFKHSRRRSSSVREALVDRAWVSNIKLNPSLQVLSEYLQLWELIDSLAPSQFADSEDSLSWWWTESGVYSASSAYNMQLQGRIHSAILPQVWKAKAMPKCRLHTWLLMQDKCLTTDNLAKRGWPHHPTCKFCFLHPETGLHLSATCSFSRELWRELLRRLGLPATLAPSPDLHRLQSWWERCSRIVPKNTATRWRSLALVT
ncbi:hypothetical protein ACQ4PT_048824 [Festuca glaucescens]